MLGSNTQSPSFPLEDMDKIQEGIETNQIQCVEDFSKEIFKSKERGEKDCLIPNSNAQTEESEMRD